MEEPWTLSAVELARRIRKRELSPVEAVDACIARIEAVNPALNAVVATRFDEARREARLAEAAVRRGDDGDLLGVPCTIKEFVQVEGMPNTGGLLARRGTIAPSDATVVRRLRRAGAIVLGVTNAPEGGLWPETSNPVYGRTNNPHDLRRTSGGSSGGEGAILAAGGSPFGLGSDTGGSVRIPAGFCGICSHKPTGGLVPSSGHFPHAPRGHGTPMQIGPMARSVDDLVAVLRVIAGPDGLDPQCRPMPLGDPAEVDLSRLVVHALPSNGTFRPSRDVEAAVHRAAFALRERGARLAEWSGPDLSRGFELWAAMLSESGERYDDIVGGGIRRPSPVAELVRWPFGRSAHSGGVVLVLLVELLVERLPGRSRLAERARALRDELDAALGPTGVLIHPVYPTTAPRHRAIVLRDPRDVAATALFNVTESPVTVVRVDTAADGLPIGVQVVARRGNDALCLAAARALEEAFGAPAPAEVSAPAAAGARRDGRGSPPRAHPTG